MRALTLLTDLRTELHLAEQVTAQAWEYYAQHVSEASFAAVLDATQCTIRLHQQLASRLEQLLGQRDTAAALMDGREHRTPSAA